MVTNVVSGVRDDVLRWSGGYISLNFVRVMFNIVCWRKLDNPLSAIAKACL